MTLLGSVEFDLDADLTKNSRLSIILASKRKPSIEWFRALIKTSVKINMTQELFGGTALIVYSEVDTSISAYNIAKITLAHVLVYNAVSTYNTASVSHFGLVNDFLPFDLKSRYSDKLVLLLCRLFIGMALGRPESLPVREIGIPPMGLLVTSL